MISARRFLPALVLAELTLGCYRPRVIDCVVACGDGDACPSNMTCSAGLCTRGATCVPEISAGMRHSCAVRGGTVACWGNNAYGQLGIGSTQNQGGDPAPIVPVLLPAGRVAIAVAAGGRHSCAIVADASVPGPRSGQTAGVVVCWGDDSFGQLGIADGRARGVSPGDGFDTVPLGGRTARALAAGLTHTCALLDDADATVVCWGDNRFGQLGIPRGSPPDGSPPDGGPPDGGSGSGFQPVGLGGPASALAAGAYHSCALVRGAVRCWGWNDYGQLGDRTQPGGDTAPGSIVTVGLPGGLGAKAIATGAFHGCAILESDAVACWGQNDSGQLGVLKLISDPGAPEVLRPGNLVDLGAGRTASLVVAGSSHTCALLDDFSVKCWGGNLDGELGLGDALPRGADDALGDALSRVPLGPEPVRRLAAGANHTCAVQAAAVKCWGLGDSGRLGVGDPINRGDGQKPGLPPVTLGAGP